VSKLQRIETLARRWAARECTMANLVEVFRLAHPTVPRSRVWPLFVDLAEQVELYDRFNDGRAHWSDINNEITGLDRSEQAADEITIRVDAAARALIDGRAA